MPHSEYYQETIFNIHCSSITGFIIYKTGKLYNYIIIQSNKKISIQSNFSFCDLFHVIWSFDYFSPS